MLIGGGKKCKHTHDCWYVLLIPTSHINSTLFDHNDTGLDLIFYPGCFLYFK